jgi:hypothetical protein
MTTASTALVVKPIAPPLSRFYVAIRILVLAVITPAIALQVGIKRLLVLPVIHLLFPCCVVTFPAGHAAVL